MATWDPTRDPGLDSSQKPADLTEQALSGGDTSAPQEMVQGDAIAVDGTNAVDGMPHEAALSAIEHQIADNDVLAAITSVTPDTLASIEHALDQLTSTTDLFDVPALDFDSGTGS
jgi:hypothetical protein